ncbi:hypothetical protein [Streptomyces sp. YIM 98790]|uniref:hypothetical protein n=1 Tax=Streptomyces sp. YIM 98790 TaxID=2689077 RepID=UPI001409B38A|nr:hypothetical protein [Streptomyces sp. YIM 98790]
MTGARRALAVAGALVLAFSLPSHAWADLRDGGDSDTSGDSDGDGDIGAGAQVRIRFTPEATSPEGALTSSVWRPPACYYAPLRTPEEMEAYWADMLAQFHTPPWPPEDVQSIRDSHERFLEEYPDYNLEQQGDGAFWGVVRNDDYPLEEQLKCEYRTFWVDFEDPPPVEPFVVDTQVLAELAWEQTRVPDTELSLNPDVGEQKVNLPMWVWLDGARFAPVTVRAELPDYGIWSETTATPVSLRLEPGTEDAVLYPSDGVCEIGSDGRIGEPYTAGRAGEDPPCGVRYLRATHDGGSYPLQATLTWEVTWQDYTGNTGDLPDGNVDDTVEVTVQEIQTIVR